MTRLIAAPGVRGVRRSMLVDGPIDADLFEAVVEQVLAPNCGPVTALCRTTSPATSEAGRGR